MTTGKNGQHRFFLYVYLLRRDMCDKNIVIPTPENVYTYSLCQGCSIFCVLGGLSEEIKQSVLSAVFH